MTKTNIAWASVLVGELIMSIAFGLRTPALGLLVSGLFLILDGLVLALILDTEKYERR